MQPFDEKIKFQLYLSLFRRKTGNAPDNWNAGIPENFRKRASIRPPLNMPANLVLLVRSGETMRNAFPGWQKECFRTKDGALVYTSKDLNQPTSLPDRGPYQDDLYAYDPPMTEFGHL